MAESAAGPGAVYPVILSTRSTTIRDGNVTNRPIYVALAVTVDGHRDILGLWAGDGGGAPSTGSGCCRRSKNPRRHGLLHRGLRRAQALAGHGHAGRAADYRANLHRASAAEQFPLLEQEKIGPRSPQTSNPSTPRRRQAAALDRFADFSENESRNTRDHQTVDRRMGRIRAIPTIRHRNPHHHVHHQRHRIDQRPHPPSSQRPRGHFPTEQAALKCVYLAPMSLDPTGTGRKRCSNRWKVAVNAFNVTFDGRVSAGRNKPNQNQLHRKIDRPTDQLCCSRGGGRGTYFIGCRRVRHGPVRRCS